MMYVNVNDDYYAYEVLRSEEYDKWIILYDNAREFYSTYYCIDRDGDLSEEEVINMIEEDLKTRKQR